MYGYGYNPYTSGPSYYSNPYINPYEAALAQERARRAQEQRETYARALAQQERERRARAAAARRNPYGFGLGGFYDPEEDEEYDYGYGYAEPALKRQRELDDAARLKALYNRAARGDEMDVDSTPASAPKAAPRRKSPSPARGTSIPIRVHTSAPKASPTPAPAPARRHPSPQPHQPTPAPAPVPQIEPTQAAHTAASLIQRTYRRHAALRQLQSLRSKFEELTGKFDAPGVLEYTVKDARGSEDGLEEVAEVGVGELKFKGWVRPQTPVVDEGKEEDAEMKEGGAESQPVDSTSEPQPQLDTSTVPPLAYTPSTRLILAQNEALLRLLNALDAVPSWGDSTVREARKHLAKDVEGEAAKLEAWWRAVWREKGGSAKVKRVRA
ncbi:unnamed protein product [Peniophora sp. CBMAI 1063]|nr:unnamed protein product [Peniophora sp. CBMAI 1063]